VIVKEFTNPLKLSEILSPKKEKEKKFYMRFVNIDLFLTLDHK
jgi:hypothetical protein